MFIVLTEADDRVEGSAQLWDSPAKGGAARSETWTVTGTRSDDNVSLTVNLGLGTTVTWNGTLGDELVLDMPDDGVLRSVTFTPATVEDFTAKVAAGQADADRRAADAKRETDEAAARKREAAEHAERLKAVTSANWRLTGAAQTVKSQTSTVNRLTFDSGLANFDRTATLQQTTLDRLRTEADCSNKQYLARDV